MYPANWEVIQTIDYINETRKRTSVLWLGHTYKQQISFSIGDNILTSANIQISRFGPELLNDIFRITMTRARMYIIRSCKEWMDFIDSSYSLGIRGNENKRKEGWRAADGEKEPFKDCMYTEDIRKKAVDDKYDPARRNYFRYNLEEASKDNIIITVYDELKQKRLIVDGLHRAAALTRACEDNIRRTITNVKIFECYGSHVNIIFSCDIHQLPS
jgi:hypothetical protein